MPFDEEEHKRIERLINGDTSIDVVKICAMHYGDNRVDYTNTVPLTMKLFNFLSDCKSRSSLSTLDINIASCPEEITLKAALGNALASTSLAKVDNLRLRTGWSGNATDVVVLKGLAKSHLEVKNLDLELDCSTSQCIRYLASFLSKTSKSLESLVLPFVKCASQDDVLQFGQAFRQLTSLSNLNLYISDEDEGDPTYAIQQKLIVSDLSSLRTTKISVSSNDLLNDIVSQVQLPKLANLKCLHICAFDWKTDLSRFSSKIGKAIQSHPTVDLLHLGWSYTPLSFFNGFLPALENCKSLCLDLVFDPAERDDCDGTNENELRQAELDALLAMLGSPYCSQLETLDLEASDIVNSPEELGELAQVLGSASPRLKSLSLRNKEWAFRDENAHEYRGDQSTPFPQPAEREAFLEIARLCPSLVSLSFPEHPNANDNWEVAKALCKNRMHFDELLVDKIPASIWPSIIAMNMKEAETSYNQALPARELLFELLKEKMERVLAEQSPYSEAFETTCSSCPTVASPRRAQRDA